MKHSRIKIPRLWRVILLALLLAVLVVKEGSSLPSPPEDDESLDIVDDEDEELTGEYYTEVEDQDASEEYYALADADEGKDDLSFVNDNNEDRSSNGIIEPQTEIKDDASAQAEPGIVTESNGREPDSSLTKLDLEDQIYDSSTPEQLYALWRAAKHHLALSGKLNLDTKVSEALTLLSDVSISENSDREEKRLFREQPLKTLQDHIFSVLSTHSNFMEVLAQKHSNRHWRGWDGDSLHNEHTESEHEGQNNDKKDKEAQNEEAEVFSIWSLLSSVPTDLRTKYSSICSPSALDKAVGLVRLAQLLLFERQLEVVELVCRPLIDDLQPDDLLKRAIDMNDGGLAQTNAEVLLAILQLSRQEISNATDMVALRNIYEKLLTIAVETNHPVAHMMLARYFASSSEQDADPLLTEQKSMRDCNRATSHLLQVVESVLHDVRNLLTGALERHDRISAIHATGLAYDQGVSSEAVSFPLFSSREEYHEHEMHLLELARGANRFDDGGGALDERGMLAVQLGDLYYFGAPELGIPPQLGRAERMYRRALRARNPLAASHLATMTFHGETTRLISQRDLSQLDGTSHHQGNTGFDPQQTDAGDGSHRHPIHDDDDDDDDYEAVQSESNSKNANGNQDDTRRNETAFALYAKAAEWGDPMGHIGLGVFYLSGGAPQVPNTNASAALEHFGMAAAGGVSEGDYRAARILLYSDDASGEGVVKKNVTEGLLRLRRAAESGHVNAAYELGLYIMETSLADGEEFSCRESLEWLLAASRSDWTDFIPFDSARGLRAFLDGRENDALNIYLMADVGLWQARAAANAGFLLEQGQLPIMEPNWTYWNAIETAWTNLRAWNATKSLSQTESLLHFLGSLVFSPFSMSRTPSYMRSDELGVQRSRWAVRLYKRSVIENGDSESQRRVAECVWDGWKGACESSESEQARKTHAMRLLHMASEEDAASAWWIGNLRWKGEMGLKKNTTQAMEEFNNMMLLDYGNSWALVEACKLWISVEEWLGLD